MIRIVSKPVERTVINFEFFLKKIFSASFRGLKILNICLILNVTEILLKIICNLLGSVETVFTVITRYIFKRPRRAH